MKIRPISHADDAAMAKIIRTSLEAYGLDKPGTAYFDPFLDHLTDYYAGLERAAYLVLEEEGVILGGAGFAPISGDIAELQKLYLDSSQRGKGYSSSLLKMIFDQARAAGYKQLYLETGRELSNAIHVYNHYGFKTLEAPLPNEAGHTAMDIWMIKDL